MAWREKLGALAVVLALLTAEGCNGFGSNCSTNADCQAQNPEAVCDPTLKVCFVYSGPVVTSIQPANQTPNVAADNAQVVATFSTSIVDAGPSTFLVVGQGFDTYGSYTLNAASTQATFTPLAAGLALGTDYTVSLTAGIADTSGNPLLPFTSTFSTADGTFGSGGTLRPGLDVGAYTLGGIITEASSPPWTSTSATGRRMTLDCRSASQPLAATPKLQPSSRTSWVRRSTSRAPPSRRMGPPWSLGRHSPLTLEPLQRLSRRTAPAPAPGARR